MEILYLRIIYIFAIILWVILVNNFGLLPADDVIEWILLLLPPILFIMAIASMDSVSDKVECFNIKGNILTLGITVIVPLLGWMATKYSGNRELFIKLCALAIFFSILTLLEVWVPERNLKLLLHVKSILQTASVSIILIAIYKFFLDTSANSLATGLASEKYDSVFAHNLFR